MAETFAKPDVRQLEGQDLPAEPFPAERRQDFRVYLAAEVHERIVGHAAEDVRVEVCGVLVGHWGRDDDGPYVKVHEVIRSDLAAGRSGEVTFTHDAWAEISKEMDTRFPELTIVGWYHSHPDFGIFLSQRDCFIHEHFFSSPGQIAYVVDPVRRIEGVFAWHAGKPVPCAYYWVGDRIVTELPDVPRDPPVANDRAVGQLPSPSARPAPAESASRAAGGLFGDGWRLVTYVLVFLVGYLLAGLPGAWQRERIVEGTVAHFGVWKGLRLGLREHLNAVDANLQKMGAAVNELSADRPQPAEEAASEEAAAGRKEQWQALQTELLQTRRLVGAIEDRYCLDPAELAIAARLVAEKVAELKLQASEDAKGRSDQAKPQEGEKQGHAPKAASQAAPRPESQPKAPASQPRGKDG